jgi:hypothetical protein
MYDVCETCERGRPRLPLVSILLITPPLAPVAVCIRAYSCSPGETEQNRKKPDETGNEIATLLKSATYDIRRFPERWRSPKNQNKTSTEQYKKVGAPRQNIPMTVQNWTFWTFWTGSADEVSVQKLSICWSNSSISRTNSQTSFGPVQFLRIRVLDPKIEQNRTISKFLQFRPRCTRHLRRHPPKSFDFRNRAPQPKWDKWDDSIFVLGDAIGSLQVHTSGQIRTLERSGRAREEFGASRKPQAKCAGQRTSSKSGQEVLCRAAAATYDPDKLHKLFGPRSLKYQRRMGRP